MISPDDLPWSSEAEQSVLGGLLLDNRAWDRVCELLLDKMFFSARHSAIYGAIGSLANANKPADVITVYDRLQDMAHREEAAGEVDRAYLNALAQSVPSGHHARRYAEIVLEKWRLRAILEQADANMETARGPGTADEKLDKIASSIGALERQAVGQVPVPMDRIVVDVVDHINALHEGGEKLGWSTRLPTLDELLGGGFQPGLVYLLGGRPGMGKSSLALWWLVQLAVLDDLTCGYLSQEMSLRECGQRALSSLGRISYSLLRKGEITTGEAWGAFTKATERLAKSPLHIDEQVGLTGNDIRIKARYIKGVKVLVLDYVQLCRGVGEGEQTRNAELEAISRSTKQLAKELNCAVVVLSALNRKVDERHHQRPIMSDFKDCGALEADADVIMTLYPARKEPDSTGSKIMGLDIIKQRQGPVGEIALNFWGDLMSWGESQYEIRELLKSHRGGPL